MGSLGFSFVADDVMFGMAVLFGPSEKIQCCVLELCLVYFLLVKKLFAFKFPLGRC